jgi:hypothetical protein
MAKNYHVLMYDVVDDFIERRAAIRTSHLELIHAARDRGDLLMAGAFQDPADGTLLVFRVESASEVEDFAKADPYVTEGLVTDWRVRRWTEILTGE